ncbi:MAG TPA: tripartite tricarboxylate transporter substrate binding protein [Ramlibacter sp.]|nr:tripartite tricarboxylate transporter substrate binding protein [Ramlibacter sp.]
MTSRRTFMALCALASVSPAWSQEFPSKPIRIVVPASAGSGTDATARFMAEGLTKAWGVPVMVENKMGAGGVIGGDFVAKAAPDGYTVLFNYAQHYSSQWVEKTPYDAVKDFEPIARLASSTLVLVTAPNSPFNSVRDLVAAAKRKPRTISYGSAGQGSTAHMAGALMSSLADIDLTHIPYKSASQAAIDAAGGQLDLTFGGLATSLPLIKAGRLKALAVTTAARSQHLAQVPTLAESGLAGYDIGAPIWALAPRGTPQAIVKKMSDELVRLASSKDFRDFCLVQGFEVDVQDAATYRAAAPAELEKWRRLVALTKDKAS